MTFWLALPFALQGFAMAVDEFYFHRQRGLPRWERIGHPLDTLTVLACLGVANATAPSSAHLAWYAGLAVFSCLFITKDEFVHKTHCTAGEQWLHSLLFVLHPICLLAAATLWRDFASGLALRVLFAALAAVFLYQTLYWSWPWARTPK